MNEDNEEYNKGSGTSRICPRRGMVYLRPSPSEILGVPTNCKSWRCVSCRNRKLGMVASLMQYGLSGQGQAFMISVTYVAHLKKGGQLEKFVDATSAQKDWRELVRGLHRNPRNKNLAMFRIVELTRKNQIHFHLLAHGMPTKLAKKEIDCKRHLNYRLCPYPRCTCMTCEWSQAWAIVTQDSWVIKIKEIYDNEGASWYLCKYLQKDMYGPNRTLLDSLGFVRRYYRTRNWASDIQMRRRGSLEKRWQRVSWVKGPPEELLIAQSKDHPLMEQVGTDLAKALQQKGQNKRYATLHAQIRQRQHSRRS